MPDTSSLPGLAIAITTFQRRGLLTELLESIDALDLKPHRVFVVDNENSDETAQLVGRFAWATYIGMPENAGGAGGFSRGVGEAYAAGYDWVWVMDDDVKVLPGALERLSRWMTVTDDQLVAGHPISAVDGVYQGSRLNFDSTPFYWQYHFINALGIPNPVAPSGLDEPRPMNTACFEGGLFHRRVIELIGLPDPRFFIYSDDSAYGYLASKVTQMKLVPDLILQRTRTLEHFKLGTIRKLNATSNMTRYYIMRNRGYLARYLRLFHEYYPVLFGLGTAMTFAKEAIRLFVTKDFRAGFGRLWRGWRDSHAILRDKEWRPMPPLAV